jgi:hypothetical protein
LLLLLPPPPPRRCERKMLRVILDTSRESIGVFAVLHIERVELVLGPKSSLAKRLDILADISRRDIL